MKKIKLGIVMDPITNINIAKDSSFAILMEAQRRKYEIYYMELKDLYLQNSKAYCCARLLEVSYNFKKWFNFGEQRCFSMEKMDVVFMRKDPPFNNEFAYAATILEYAEKQGVLVINKPQSLKIFNEKIFINHFPKLIPNTLVSNNLDLIRTFYLKNKNIILKPLNMMGGTSIFLIKENDPNCSVIIETLTDYGKYFCMAQKYLENVKNGDKRILIVNGKAIDYCLIRIPKHGEIRANLAVSGNSIVKPLTDHDRYIANIVGPILKSKGLILVGLDVIDDKLTEINITSPTCIKEIESLSNISITNIILNTTENLLGK